MPDNVEEYPDTGASQTLSEAVARALDAIYREPAIQRQPRFSAALKVFTTPP